MTATGERPTATGPDADAYREDLVFLRDVFPRIEKSFTPDTVQQFRVRVDAVLERVAELNRARFAMGVAHAVAAADNAHTMAILLEYLRVAPVRLHWFSDGLYAIRTATGPAALVGARILSVEGQSPENWLARLRDYIPGTAARCRAFSVFFLTCPEALSCIVPGASSEHLNLVFRDRGGNEATCVLERAPLAQNAALFPRLDPDIALASLDELPWRQVPRWRAGRSRLSSRRLPECVP